MEILNIKLSSILSHLKGSKRNWIFIEDNNHSYVSKEITFRKKCINNLVILHYNFMSLKNVEDAFVFISSKARIVFEKIS